MVLNNNKGQVVFYRAMMAILILIAVVIISPAVKEVISNAYNSADLSCPTTNNPTMIAVCVVLDNAIFFFLGSCAAVGLAFLAGKKDITGVISAITIFIVTVVMINPLKQWIVYIRDTNHLGCSITGITMGNQLACIFFDVWLFWFICTVIGAGLTYIFVDKVLMQ